MSACDRLIVTLAFEFDRPADYLGQWPPTLADIGDYVGRRFWHGRRLAAPFGTPLSEGRIWQRLRAVCSKWSPAALEAVQELGSRLAEAEPELPARARGDERRAA